MSNANRDAQDPPRQPELLRWLRWKIAARPPYCQGTLALPNSDFTLFYGTEGDAHRINLSASSTAQLQHLAETCAPATFGVAGEDVYDETYRKAGKLDNKDFAIGFDARSSSLVDVIRTELLVESPTWVTSENLNIELYKLNVYGKDAFFRAHVDTPRSELMFGSLVIVFPTPHEGGALKLRAAGDGNGRMLEWTFDSSALLAQQEQPSIAYVAFFSDVEHEVMPVTSGHRVSITYNLFYAVTASPSEPSSPTLGVPVPRQISTNEQSFTDALRAVLADPSFLPDGGNLMFGLRHQYPLATASESEGRYMRRRDTEEARETARAALRALEGRLKATDGVMLRALRGSGLDAGLRVLYEAHWSKWDRTMGYVMADRVLPLPHVDHMIEESAVEVLQGEGGELVQDAVVLMARAIKREKARAEAKVRLEARAAERAKAKAEAEAKAEAKAKAKAEAEAGTEGEVEANKDEAKSKTNKDSAEAMAEKEQDKDEAESEGKEHDEDDDDNDSDGDQHDEDEEEDEDEDEDEDEEEDEDEDDYEYELAHAFPWSRDDDATPVFWVTDPPRVRSGKGFQKTIQTYGNEPSLDVVYWRIWIFARVGSVGQRETAQARASEE